MAAARHPVSERAGGRCCSPARPQRGACMHPAWPCAATATRWRDAQCRPAAAPQAAIVATASRTTPLRNRGHWRVFRGACRDTDRRIVEPQHDDVAIDAAGRQPVTRACARRRYDLERAVSTARNLLASEAITIRAIGHETPVEIVERHRPEARGGRGPGDRD